MPIAKIQLPDGRIGRFEVAEGTTPDQVLEFANNQFGGQQQIQQPQERVPTQPTQYVERNTLYNPDISQGKALLTTATNIPFAPRIKAGLSAISAKAQGGDESISRFYDEALSNELSKLRQAREQYPKQSFASQLATDVVGGGGILKGLGLAGNTAKQALVGGAVIGGPTALGETADISNLPQSLTDLASGLIIGGGGAVAGQQAGKALGKASKALPDIIQKFKPNTPEKVLSKVITPEEAGQQARKLASKLKEKRITYLPEQGDEGILGLTRLLGKTQGSNKIISDYINTRSATSTRRVSDLINNKISGKNYFDKLDDIIIRRKALSSPLYEQAEQEFNQNIAKFLEPKFKNVVNNVESNIVDPTTGKNFITQKIVKEELPLKKLYDNPAIDIYIKKAINDPKFADPRINKSSFQALQKAKEVVDSEMETSIGTTKRALGQIKNEIINVIEKFSPSYKKARNTYADLSSLKSAQEEGLNIGKLRNEEEVKRYLKILTSGEKEAYKIGVKDYLIDKVMKTGDANSSARKIFSQPLEREKIKAVFNNPKEFNDFARRMNDEIRIFDTKQRIVGGSRTDFNIQEGAELLDKVAKGAINAKTFGISNVILTATDAIKKRYYGLNEKTAKELARIIVDPFESVKVLNRIYQKAQTPQEKMLIQKFADHFANKNFTAPIASKLGRAMATEQLNNEENQNGI